MRQNAAENKTEQLINSSLKRIINKSFMIVSSVLLLFRSILRHYYLINEKGIPVKKIDSKV